MATKKWFVQVGTEEMGPLGPRGLRKLVRLGQVKADTLVRREDHAQAVLAAEVRGLMPLATTDEDDIPSTAEVAALVTDEAKPGRTRHRHAPRAIIHGPFTALRPLGWSTAAAMFAFALLGVYGIVVAIGQLQHAAAVLGGEPLVADRAAALLFGLGVWAVLALVAVGGLFLWWLWIARVNLPHLIHAHVRLAPSWAVLSWFLPFVNLFRPYAIIAETDRLSAEADADGDLRVQADHALLASWWSTALLGTAFALAYLFIGKATGEAAQQAAWLHLLAGATTLLSGLLCGWLVLRITNNQERAHERHPEPVEPKHPFKHRKERIPILQGAAN